MTVSTILRGGIGNNLFGIATVLAYALKHNCGYCIPTEIDNPHYEGQKVFYSEYLRYGNIEELSGNIRVYNEPFFHYKEIPKYDCDILILSGYFQSGLFFDDYRKEILRILDIPHEFKEGYVAIHWRLGDYRNLESFHPTVSLDYIHSGIKYFTDKGYKKFIVFSDEIDFCYDNIKSPYDCNIGFSQGRTEIEDLILASSCENCVCSNSSYSWWIYYLNKNKNKIGIFPKTWFGEFLPNDTKDLIMPEMILL